MHGKGTTEFASSIEQTLAIVSGCLWRSWLVLGGLSLAVACGTTPLESAEREDPLNTWTNGDETEDGAAPSQPENVVTPPPPQAEICDGRDNDQDGQIDEETDAGSCVGDGGEAGTMKCVNGVMGCAVCEPGATREKACHCSDTRVDICGENHEWLVGPCDECANSVAIPCGFCGVLGADGQCQNPGECQPGQSRFERCDSCPAGVDCSATTCVGRKLSCGSDCRWIAVEACLPRQPECSRDEMRSAKCGQCGDSTESCDGCFWDSPADCHEEGQCFIGSTQAVVCGSCGGFQSATATCNAQCQWDVGACDGCEPGPAYDRTSGCRCGGTRLERFQCVLEQVGACGVGRGHEIYLETVEECPPYACYPGERDTSTGTCRECQDDCTTWGACGEDVEPPPPPPPPPTCGCSGTRTVSCNDPCGNTRTDTCVSCAWQIGTCAACTH